MFLADGTPVVVGLPVVVSGASREENLYGTPDGTTGVIDSFSDDPDFPDHVYVQFNITWNGQCPCTYLWPVGCLVALR